MTLENQQLARDDTAPQDRHQTVSKALRTCPWCGDPFLPRASGGKPQRFCSPDCRRAMDAALRAWAQDQLSEGRVTVGDLQRAGCSEARQADG